MGNGTARCSSGGRRSAIRAGTAWPAVAVAVFGSSQCSRVKLSESVPGRSRNRYQCSSVVQNTPCHNYCN